jgi:acyl-CoA synthetase (AMP-forming)/AMP-acid ligase II
MHLTTLLEMAADGFGDRVAFGTTPSGLTFAGLLGRARRTGEWAVAHGVERIGLVDVNSDVVPTLLYGSGFAGLPFVPINYRLADEQLRDILARIAPAVVVVEDEVPARVGPVPGVEMLSRSAFVSEVDDPAPGVSASASAGTPDDIAILLFTSGTTGDSKAAVLRHKHLASYVIGTVEFMGAEDDEAALVSVPPYHVAGVSAILTSVFAGRRVVYLPAFTPDAWVDTARGEGVTQAMVVPTMLGRILDVLERDGERLPRLRHLSYGGGPMPVAVIERALDILPHVEFVNAYGLTETSSTVSVLGPEDHRQAVASDDPAVRGRLRSVGRPLPSVEVSIRDAFGEPVPPGETGEIWVRGEQVAGEYLGRAGTVEGGWFHTRDGGHMDAAGYLYLEGRLDDVIVRGAENMSPGEIEDALIAHPSVAEAAVVGIPDTEWGEKVVAAVVLTQGTHATEAELQGWVRSLLRSSKTPERIDFRDNLPHNETGKLLRRVLRSELASAYGGPSSG